MNHINANIAANLLVTETDAITWARDAVVLILKNGKRLAFRFDIEMAEECRVLLDSGLEYDSQSMIVEALLEATPAELTKRYFEF